MTAPHTAITGDGNEQKPVTIFGPDFPFAYDDWLAHADGLGQVPPEHHGREVAIIGAGMAGIVAAYELMKMGLKPVVYESRRLGGRLHSEPFKGAEGVIAWNSPMDSLAASLDVGFALPGRYRLSVGGAVPVAGTQRYRWRTRASVAVQFN